jgi:hypothetical protein
MTVSRNNNLRDQFLYAVIDFAGSRNHDNEMEDISAQKI